MDLAIGAGVGLLAGALGTLAGFDRDRAFYPTIMIVIAAYYVLFAATGGDRAALWSDTGVGLVYAAAAILGFRTSLWLVVAALAAHGAMDLVHGQLIANDGVPPWWPGFCCGADIVLAAYLAVLLLLRGEPRRSPAV